ncbi:hypothetical protein [Streptomyces violascens]|uniref:hypothetical protein n=1 Tax=Streptomyces violascens TaxID=67381 RepID=UPI0036B83C70
MSTPDVAVPDPAMEPEDTDSENLPPLLRRPNPVPDPLPVKSLPPVRKALVANPKSRLLDLDAASVVTSGAVDPPHLRAFAEEQMAGDDIVNLLASKPVVGGELTAVPIHRRYLDIGVLPDFVLNQRWGHLQHTAMDSDQPKSPPTEYETLIGEESGLPLPILSVRLKDRHALAAAVKESMRQTFEAEGGENDYTDSVLQQGVKEPMTLFIVRVCYADDSMDTFLVTGDGNSRLVSLWLARTGGDLDKAAASCIATVIGPLNQPGGHRAAHDRAARRTVGEMTSRIRRGLAEPRITEATQREGHSVTFPATVIVGAWSEDGKPLEDLVAARDEILANLHVHVRAWADGAQSAQGMHRVYRHAAREGLVTQQTRRILGSSLGVQALQDHLGLPAHRLWSAAVHQHTVLAAPHVWRMNDLIKQEFGMGKADRKRIGGHLAPLALSAYRSSETIEQAMRTFSDGGTITGWVWKAAWQLTQGDSAHDVLDEVLHHALAGDDLAIAELTVLGGTAAILDGYSTRERGSKESITRSSNSTPYRVGPVPLLTLLSKTQGGLRMLHSIARAHVAADDTVRPKQFHTQVREYNGRQVTDGDPVIDKADAQETIEYEWDLVYAGDPTAAEAAIEENKARLRGAQGGIGGANDSELPEDVRLRRRLDAAVNDAYKAVQGLVRMTQHRGREVLGSPETVDALCHRLRKVDNFLVRYGPIRTDGLITDLDEDDEA